MILAVGLSYSLLGYILTVRSGYFDDSLFVVAVARTLPSNWTGAASALMEAPGDTYAPFLFGLTWLARDVGLLGNGLMNAFGAIALTAMGLSVFWLARSVGVPKFLATAGGLLALLNPALVDQRVWFVSLQHTFTVVLLTVAVALSITLLQPRASQAGTRQMAARVALLDLVMVLLSFGREIVLGASVLAVMSLFAFGGRSRLRLVVAVAWIIPVPILMRAVLTGRAGTQVGAVGIPGMDTSFVSRLTEILDQSYLPILLGLLTVAILLQTASIVHAIRHPSQDNLPFVSSPAGIEINPVSGALALLITLGAGVAALVAAPRVVTMVASSLPGANLLVTYDLTFASRWAMLYVPLWLWVFIVVALLGILAMRPRQLDTALLAMSMLAVTPYVASNFVQLSLFSWETGLPQHVLSRYVIYLIPASVLVAAMLSRSLWQRFRVRTGAVAVLLICATALTSYQVTTHRAGQVKGVVVVDEGSGTLRLAPTDAVREYRVGYGESLPGLILGDYEALADDKGLTPDALGKPVRWSLN